MEAAVEQANRTLNQGKLNEAEKQVDAAQKLYPDKPETWNLRGAIFLKQRRLDDAAEQFAKALQLDPKLHAAVDATRSTDSAAYQTLRQPLAAMRAGLGRSLAIGLAGLAVTAGTTAAGAAPAALPGR